ncbi:MAG: cobalamin-independent methionine synthase II family protein [Verrucomicrobiaceae bacterium]|nr:cobalamin-independent methionine synthase II family protein [Verrucomicrobiaceae bacterium]
MSRILTTTVGSYPVPEWLSALPSEQAVIDATRVVFNLQRQAGIDLPTDGELYRFDVNHPDTNGMIEYFVSKLGGIDSKVSRADGVAFRAKKEMGFRSKPAAVVRSAIDEGWLDLQTDCARAAKVAGGDFKFTLTSPYMLARTLLDLHYKDMEALTLAIADALAAQVGELDCACVQVDEANIPGNPSDGPLAANAINRILDACKVQTAVHFCFGNYGGQTIQSGGWKPLLEFLNALHTDHLVLELAHRPEDDLDALKELDPKIGVGLGVVDIKVNHIETADQIAKRIEKAAAKLGAERVKYIHPDCGFWMLKRSIADRKIEALSKGRDLFEGR